MSRLPWLDPRRGDRTHEAYDDSPRAQVCSAVTPFAALFAAIAALTIAPHHSADPTMITTRARSELPEVATRPTPVTPMSAAATRVPCLAAWWAATQASSDCLVDRSRIPACLFRPIRPSAVRSTMTQSPIPPPTKARPIRVQEPVDIAAKHRSLAPRSVGQSVSVSRSAGIGPAAVLGSAAESLAVHSRREHFSDQETSICRRGVRHCRCCVRGHRELATGHLICPSRDLLHCELDPESVSA